MTDQPPRDLAELRLRAERAARAEDDRALLELVDQLRGDEEWWAHLWGPAAAMAAQRLGAPNAVLLLEESIDGGFSQPELFEGELEKLFDAAWPELSERMRANVPPPVVELLDWPVAGSEMPLDLHTIAADRVDGLLSLLPSPSPSAWETARRMLAWVHSRWDHANDHVEDPDALNVLERVDAGERFACVEYSIVLSQALNAVRIPARRVDLRQANHHVGVGRGHVVSEAWIDDLDRWVLLDGQNGAYWVDEGGHPLGVRELQRLDEVPVFTRDGEALPSAASWFTYFASATTTGYTWAEGSFAPVFQASRTIRTPRLLRDGDLAYPRLSALTTALDGTGPHPRIRFTHAHPYGTAVHLDGEPVDDWPLDLTPGDHEHAVTIATPYGQTAPQTFSYRVNPSSGR